MLLKLWLVFWCAIFLSMLYVRVMVWICVVLYDLSIAGSFVAISVTLPVYAMGMAWGLRDVVLRVGGGG